MPITLFPKSRDIRTTILDTEYIKIDKHGQLNITMPYDLLESYVHSDQPDTIVFSKEDTEHIAAVLEAYNYGP